MFRPHLIPVVPRAFAVTANFDTVARVSAFDDPLTYPQARFPESSLDREILRLG